MKRSTESIKFEVRYDKEEERGRKRRLMSEER